MRIAVIMITMVIPAVAKIHLLRSSYVPGTVLSSFCILTHLVLTKAL